MKRIQILFQCIRLSEQSNRLHLMETMYHVVPCIRSTTCYQNWLAKREFYFNHYKEYETTLNSKMQHTVACRGKSN